MLYEKITPVFFSKRNQSKALRRNSVAVPQEKNNTNSINKFMIPAKAIYYNGTKGIKVYLGENLVWEKSGKPVSTHTIEGKFSDVSTEADWKCKINGNEVVLSVDPTTQEFSYNVEGEVTSLIEMFYDSFSPYHKVIKLNLSHFDTSNVTNMSRMFERCTQLESLDVSNLNTSSVTNMYRMFMNCGTDTIGALDLSHFDTSKVMNMNYMFSSSNFTSLNLSGWNVSKVGGKTAYMFNNCKRLTTLNLSGWNMAKLDYYSYTFDGATALSTVLGPITGLNNVHNYIIDLKYCPLSNASAMVFINGLAEMTQEQTITFKASTYDTLTPEQIAVATSKGWNVVRSA